MSEMRVTPHEEEPGRITYGGLEFRSDADPRTEPVLPPPPAPRRERRGLGRVLGPIGGGIAVVASKLKFLVVLTKLKFAATFLSMFVSLAAYALFWGWRFAALLVALLFVHEMGHVVQARREGLPASAPMFVPFLGALIMMRGMPKDAYAEAKVGLAGPVIGSLGALALYVVGRAVGSDLLIAAAYIGFFLNLFNLLPVPPLDGGRAMAVLPPALWALGAVLAVGVAVVLRSPFLLIFLLLFGGEAWRRWQQRRRPSEETRRYYAVQPWQRAAIATTYVALVVLLLIGLEAAHVANPRF
jgi:Zn-dependent protease